MESYPYRHIDALDALLNEQVLQAGTPAELNAALERKMRIKRELLVWPDRTVDIVAGRVLDSLRAGRVE